MSVINSQHPVLYQQQSSVFGENDELVTKIAVFYLKDILKNNFRLVHPYQAPR